MHPTSWVHYPKEIIALYFRVVCDICNTEVYNMIALKHHRVLVHKKREGFLCEYCPKKVFFCETFLNKHLKEKHSKTQVDFGNEHSD